MKKTGIELIAIERQEQIEKHNRSIADDIKYNNDEQLSFGAALLCCKNPEDFYDPNSNVGKPYGWDQKVWIKMVIKTYKQRLIIAGALIAAEIDRLNAIGK
jgi:hypothetical protein